MARRLAFHCPNTNLAVLTEVTVSDLPFRPLHQIGCEVQCPCGETHVFQASEAATLRRNSSSAPAGLAQKGPR